MNWQSLSLSKKLVGNPSSNTFIIRTPIMYLSGIRCGVGSSLQERIPKRHVFRKNWIACSKM